MNVLSNGFRQRALTGEIRAAAIVAHVTVPLSGQAEKVDAVRISLDHHDGYAVHVFFPYRKDGTRVTFAEPFACPGNLVRLPWRSVPLLTGEKPLRPRQKLQVAEQLPVGLLPVIAL